MEFALAEALPILERTPRVVRELLAGLPDAWIRANEGPDTWSPSEVVAHLIHGERTDWMARTEIMLTHGDAVTFPPFDRFGHVEAARGQSLPKLLDTFAELRAINLERLRALALAPADLGRPGRHPDFGRVTLGQHLATWVAHDLNHISQIVRVMGRQYTDAVGPWRVYLPMLGPRR